MRPVKDTSPLGFAKRATGGIWRLYVLAGCLLMIGLFFWAGFGLVSLFFGTFTPGINGWIPAISALVTGSVFVVLILLDMKRSGTEEAAGKWAGALLGGVGGVMVAGRMVPEAVTWKNPAVLAVSLTFAVLSWFAMRYFTRAMLGRR